MHRQIDGHTDRHTHRHTHRHTDRHTYRLTNRKAGRHLLATADIEGQRGLGIRPRLVKLVRVRHDVIDAKLGHAGQLPDAVQNYHLASKLHPDPITSLN